MPKFFYNAKSFKGESSTGSMEVKDEHQLARILHEQGLVLISANLEKKLGEKKKIGISAPFLRRVSLVEKLMFIRNLQVMISAGLPLPRALKTLSVQSRNKKFKNVLTEIMDEVTKGNSFSASLTKYPDVFSELFVSMVKVGEESGTLDNVLKTLSQQLEKENELKSKIIGAMIYPAVIVSVMLGIGIMMLILVVPKLAQTFEDFDVELPLTTKITVFIGTLLATKWYLLIVIIFIFIFLMRIILRTKGGKKIIDNLVLKIPIVSNIIKKTNSAFTTRTLSSLIAAGVPLVRSLEITSGTLGNYFYREIISGAVEEVRKGKKLSNILEPHQDLYPPVVVQMVAVGEETGETSNILAKLADFFEEEVDNSTKNLASVIEPLLMVVIGGVVGFFAVSMIQPMYSMLGAIQ